MYITGKEEVKTCANVLYEGLGAGAGPRAPLATALPEKVGAPTKHIFYI